MSEPKNYFTWQGKDVDKLDYDDLLAAFKELALKSHQEGMETRKLMTENIMLHAQLAHIARLCAAAKDAIP